MAVINVIKYEGDNRTFIWKHPAEDFNTLSQLIVHESQQALFFLNGHALDLFGPGRHTLDTQNLPLLNKLVNLPSGGTSAFHCEVYFINLTEQMGIRWGTDTKVQYMDPLYHFPLSLGANGELSLKVQDARRLLVHLVGTEKVLEQAQLMQFFRAFLQMRIKTYLAQLMQQKDMHIFTVDQHLTELSSALHKLLRPDFLDYGLSLERFLVSGTVKPEGDAAYEKLKELYLRQYADIQDARIRQQVGIIEQETSSQKMVLAAHGLAQKRSIEGYTYQQERGFDVAGKLAGNEGVGNFSNLGIGLGLMSGVGNSLGSTVNGIVNQTMPTAQPPAPPQAGASGAAPGGFCPACGTALQASWQFCPRCGQKKEQ